MPTPESLPLAMLRSGRVVCVGLELGLLDPAAAVAWADHWIEALPTPPVELAEVSMPGRLVRRELAASVEAVIGAVPPPDAFAIATALFARAIADGSCAVATAVDHLTSAMLAPEAGVEDAAHNDLWHLSYNAELEHPRDAAELVAAFLEFAAPSIAAWADAHPLRT